MCRSRSWIMGNGWWTAVRMVVTVHEFVAR
ncbi:hypothetical protein [Pseudomonas phage PaBSM-2607-JFK]|nr:hypothetical protein [Pseudomonas phage PaBSM-2607-JFK]